MAGGESKSVVVDTNADSKVADENAKTLKRALPQVPGITEKQPANSNVKQLANSNVKQPANSNVESLARREARAEAKKQVEALENRLASIVQPVFKDSLDAAQLRLLSQLQEREDALKVEVKTSQDSTVKKLAALVAKSSDVMSEEVEARVVAPSEDEGSDSEDKVSAAKRRRLVPSENQISMWADARRVSADFNKDDWKEVSASRILKDYSEHPDAVSFKAHQVDGEVSLSYQNQKDAEKILKTLEMQFGAIGAASTLLFEQVGQVNEAARRAARQFASSQGSQEELILQAREFSEDIMGCSSALSEISRDSLKLAAYGFNKAILERRKLFVDSVDNSKGDAARSKLRNLKPENNFLFGGKVTGLCKELRDSQLIGNQLNYNRIARRDEGSSGGKKSFKGGNRERFSKKKFPGGKSPFFKKKKAAEKK